MELSQKQKMIFGTIAIILVSIIGYYIMKQNSISEETYIVNYEETENEIIYQEEKEIIVHVAGCVRNEGIVKIKEGSRIYEAIDEAGGLLENADITNINLAYIITDGQKIYIPTLEENINELEENLNETYNYKEEDKKVNINTATKNELQELPRNRRSNCYKHNKIQRRKWKF